MNLNFCFGVRSACLMTATMPFNFQECLEAGSGGGGSGPPSVGKRIDAAEGKVFGVL